MLRAFLLIIGLGSASVFFAQWLKHKGAGYVMIYFDHYSFETSLGFLVLLVLLLALALFVVFKLLGFLIRSVLGTAMIAKNLRKQKLLDKHAEGLLAYHSEHWQQAGKQLYQSAEATDSPFINYLLSAKAYVKLKDTACAKDALNKAMQCQYIDRASVLLAQIDLAVVMQDVAKADDRLKEALSKYPKDPRVLLKAADFYQNTHAPESLTPVIASIEKQKLLPDSSLNPLKLTQIEHDFDAAVKNKDRKQIEKIYRKSKPFQQTPACYLAYFNALNVQHDMPDLLNKVEKQLKHEANSELLAFYTQISHEKTRQYEFLTHLQDAQGETSDMSLALGRVAKALNDKDKAVEYFKSSIAMNPASPAVNEMAEFYLSP